jgi:hypothetical protein
MTRKIENYINLVKQDGFNTDKNATFGGTVAITGALTATGGVAGSVSATTLDVSGLTKTSAIVNQNTVVVIDAQNGTPTIAELLRGIVTHNSKTGAGTLTVPTGTLMSGGISGVAIGTTLRWVYYNYGNQTVTVTANTDHTLVGGTAAVTTGKHIYVTSYCSAANTWVSFLTTLM